ncbi:MAG: phosphoribosylglycinamide formyltransferase [Phycisphaerae bacterium]|nr:phosphoribosylglycinamide formyltransferase [Phycisphaerae bacterium]
MIRLGVLISGSGRTLQNFIDLIRDGKLDAEIAVVISSLSKVKGVDLAKSAGLPIEIVRKRDYRDIDAFSDRILGTLEAHAVDLVCLAGWTCLWRLPRRWFGRVMNIHPALLPKYGGKGFYGHHVHEAVLAARDAESGCTVHFANNEYDAGPIILQRRCPVRPTDTPDALAARVFEQELLAYPEAVRLFAAGRLRLDGDRVTILPRGR